MSLSKEKEDFLTNLYQTADNDSFDSLWRKIKKQPPENLKITQKELKGFLASLHTTQTHKQNDIINSYTASKPLEQFQIDLAFVIKRENPNDKFSPNLLSYEDPQKGGLKIPKKSTIYALTCIDIFTKDVAIRVIKNKKSETVLNAFREIVQEMKKPSEIFCDDGSEFTSTIFKKYCEDNDIELIFALNHAPHIERFHAYMKRHIEKYITGVKAGEPHRHVLTPAVFTKVINGWKDKVHSATKMDVEDASKPENHEEAFKNQLEARRPLKKRPTLYVGDKVREMKKQPRNADNKKSFTPTWSEEIYEVTDIIDKYYYLSGGKRDKYLRYMLQKVEGDVRHIRTDDKDDGTRTKRLKELNKQDVIPESYIALNKQKAEADKALAEKIEAIKNRERKKNKKYDDLP